jgi:hypothetical protein
MAGSRDLATAAQAIVRVESWAWTGEEKVNAKKSPASSVKKRLFGFMIILLSYFLYLESAHKLRF